MFIVITLLLMACVTNHQPEYKQWEKRIVDGRVQNFQFRCGTTVTKTPSYIAAHNTWYIAPDGYLIIIRDMSKPLVGHCKRSLTLIDTYTGNGRLWGIYRGEGPPRHWARNGYLATNVEMLPLRSLF